MHYDVVIVGGALMGGSTAYHLLTREPGLKVCVVEKDSTYEFAASERSNAGVRVLFSQIENLRMSQYGHEFYSNFASLAAVDGEPAALDFYRNGYLFIANTSEQQEEMEANYAFQAAEGCRADLLDPDQLKERFPALNCEDVRCAVNSPNDGWIDSHGALLGLRRKAKALGADYVEAEVVDLIRDDHAVLGVRLANGDEIRAGHTVNTAGAWAPEICRMAGWDIPVEPLPRMVFYFHCRQDPGRLAYTRDGLGVGFRPEGQGFICGITNFDWAGRFNFEVNHDWFETFIWEKLAHRVPAFAEIKVQNAWAGHYAQCLFDGNMIIGGWPGGLERFLIATGFSGHGLQHAPAVGRALAELILDGQFAAIDLSRLTFQRVLDDDPYPEVGVKA